LELILADGSIYPHKGAFAFADRQVDVQTGTLRVDATFPNPGNILRPGQYAKIRALSNTKKDALLIPQRAIMELQGKYMVSVVGPDNKISIKPVKTGQQIDSLWIIEEGLTPGERVITEGLQKVKDGMTVNPQPLQ
jgi:membrane fusion protein (multidrug efflux system)